MRLVFLFGFPTFGVVWYCCALIRLHVNVGMYVRMYGVFKYLCLVICACVCMYLDLFAPGDRGTGKRARRASSGRERGERSRAHCSRCIRWILAVVVAVSVAVSRINESESSSKRKQAAAQLHNDKFCSALFWTASSWTCKCFHFS